MKWLIDPRTRVKLFASFGVMIGVLLLVLVLAYRDLIRIQRSEQRIHANEFQTLRDINDLRFYREKIRAISLTMILVKDRQHLDYLTNLANDVGSKGDEAMRRLVERANDEKILAKLKEVSELRKVFREMRENWVLPLMDVERLEEARSRVSGVQAELNKRLESIIDEIVAATENNATAAEYESSMVVARTLNALTVVGCAVIMLFIGATAAAYRAFSEDAKERRRLEREMREISIAEQTRIGQDLHDNLGQQMTGIALKCQSIAQTLARKGLPEARTAEELTDLANKAVNQVRDLAKGLAHVDMEAGGICSALTQLARRASSIYSISCSAAFNPENIDLDMVTAVELYHIAQEGTLNAVKHGKARHVEIHLIQENNTTTLRVQDDGIGFSRAPRTNGLGYRLIRYRAHVIDGLIDLRDGTKGGTILECKVRKK